MERTNPVGERRWWVAFHTLPIGGHELIIKIGAKTESQTLNLFPLDSTQPTEPHWPEQWFSMLYKSTKWVQFYIMNLAYIFLSGYILFPLCIAKLWFSRLFPHYSLLPYSPPPPVIYPTIVHVCGSFIHGPWWPFPFFPSLPLFPFPSRINI